MSAYSGKYEAPDLVWCETHGWGRRRIGGPVFPCPHCMDTLARNLAIAGALCAAWWQSRGYEGYTGIIRKPRKEWYPGCGRPAPGWKL